MKTTIDIPDDVLIQAMKLTKSATKRDAVVGILREHIRRAKAEELVKMLGTFKDFMTPDELMDMRFERGKYGPR